MSIFDINWKTKAIELLPPDKRTGVISGYLRAWFEPIKYLGEKILTDYRIGRNYPEWIAGTYAEYDKVKFKQIVYESLVDGNTDQPPSANWRVYLPSFIGVESRVKFNSQKVVMEYALNTYFNTNFRQPPLISDIYIERTGRQLVAFRIGQTVGSTIAQHDTASYAQWTPTSYNAGDIVVKNGLLYTSLVNSNTEEPPTDKWHPTEAIGYPSVFTRSVNFIIYFPAAVYAGTNESDIRNFVDKINTAGLFYSIATY